MSLTAVGRVTVVKAQSGSMSCEVYVSELEAVLSMVNGGSLGGVSASHGSVEHLSALDLVEEKIKKIREIHSRLQAL